MSYYPFNFKSKLPRIPQRVMNAEFGLDAPRNILTVLAIPRRKPQENEERGELSGNLDGSSMKVVNHKFQVSLDVQHYAEEDISVKTEDGYLVVEAKHEEKEDEYGFVSRGFKRRYSLPEDILEDSLTSKLSDGMLTVTIPLKLSQEGVEGTMPIVYVDVRKNDEEELSKSV